MAPKRRAAFSAGAYSSSRAPSCSATEMGANGSWRTMSFTLASSVEHDPRRHALKACGLDPDLAMTRGASYANEAWLGDEGVLRGNWRGGGPPPLAAPRHARGAARAA